jgi:hypothetical protein
VNRERWIALGVLVLLLVLFFVSIGIGVGKDRGGGQQPIRQGPVDFLGNLLVRPAQLQDLSSADQTCSVSEPLSVQRIHPCTYNLKSGFLSKRLTLTLLNGAGTARVLQEEQGQPRVDDAKGLAPNRAAEFTYRESGSTLTVTCLSLGQPCRVSLAR